MTKELLNELLTELRLKKEVYKILKQTQVPNEE